MKLTDNFYIIQIVPRNSIQNHLIRYSKLSANLPKTFNPLKPELNPSAQRCLTRFFTGDFVSLTVKENFTGNQPGG
jgi:hypothetical protein